MATSVADIAALYDGRYNEAYVIQRRDEQMQRYQTWKAEIRALRAIVAGDWRSVFPATVAAEQYEDRLQVQNLCRDDLEDVGRLATESRAAIRLEPPTRKVLDEDKAQLVEAIAAGYWRHDYAEELVAELAMDIWGDGGAFLLSLPRDGYDYPCHTRLDPLHVYPDIFDREMQDCLVVTSVKERWAANEWPDLGLDGSAKNSNDVEIIDYYSPTEICKVIRRATTRSGRTEATGFTVMRSPNPLGRVPIAWAKLPSKDGAWRGGVLQAASQVNAANRIITMILDNAEQGVYAPLLVENVANPQDYGPNAMLEPDNPTLPARATRVQPAQVNGALLGTVGELMAGARGDLAFSEGRQGVPDASIISAAGLNATQGQQITVVRAIQREGIGRIRRMQSQIDMEWDRKTLNFTKPLLYPAKDRYTYNPAADLGENSEYRLECIYGMYAGMDLPNRLVAIMQLEGSHNISRETGRAQMDEMAGSDYRAEAQRVEREMVLDFSMQKILSDPNYDAALMLSYMNGGDDFMAANAKVVAAAQQQAQAAQGQLGGAPGQLALPPGGPSATGGAPGVADQALAMQKGAIPAGGPGPEFAPPPSSTIAIGRVQGRNL